MFKRLEKYLGLTFIVIGLLAIGITAIIESYSDTTPTEQSIVCDKACQIDKQYKKIAQESVLLEKYKTASWNAGTEFMRNYSGYKATQRNIKQLQQSVNLYISKDSTPQGLEVMRDKILGLSEEQHLPKLSGQVLSGQK